jgi:hypothetical protein
MSWRYNQRTGHLYHNENFVVEGYSGFGPGKNNPKLEAVPFTGPIPKGSYLIGTPFTRYHNEHPEPWVMPLSPLGHSAARRSGFLIHGDNGTHTASVGCIIVFDPKIRRRIWDSGDCFLDVTD